MVSMYRCGLSLTDNQLRSDPGSIPGAATFCFLFLQYFRIDLVIVFSSEGAEIY